MLKRRMLVGQLVVVDDEGRQMQRVRRRENSDVGEMLLLCAAAVQTMN